MEKGKEARKERKEREEDGGETQRRRKDRPRHSETLRERDESYAPAPARTHVGIKS